MDLGFSGLFLGTSSAVFYAAPCSVKKSASLRRNEVEPPSESTCHGTARTCVYHAIVSFPVLGRGPVDDLALDWQLHENFKSAADATMQGHCPVMRGCDCIHDGKSESGPLGIADP